MAGVPWAPQTVYRPGGDHISDLILRRGQIDADRIARSGDIWGNTLVGVGQQVAGAVAQHMEQKEQSKRSKAFEAALETGDPRDLIRVLGPKDGPAVVNALKATTPDGMKSYADRMALARDVARGILAVPQENRPQAIEFGKNSLLQNGVFKPEELPEVIDEPFLRQLSAYGAEGPKDDETAVVGGALVNKRTGEAIYTAPVKPPEPKMHTVTVRGPGGVPVKKLVSEEELAAGVQEYREPRAAAAQEPLMAIVGADGQPVYVPRSQAVGKRPASNREQGRPVVSGDAGRIADLDTSLDDLNALEKTLTETKGATGTRAKAGAMLWNPISEATGWGVDAKKRQGVIDRVKQVIGKALEGGVLRKEDEYKYEKILPTIGDTQPVAESKLKGLRAALIQRRLTTLDALDDAGYDVSKFRERGGAPTTPPPVAPGDDALLKKYGY